MELTNDRRKQQQFLHIQNQFKIYKKNYKGRPLITRHIETYLQFTNFITQMIPTFTQHYFQILTKDEHSSLSQVTSTIFADMQIKLKSLAYRIQKKEIEENNHKDVKNICRVCLHELREAEIAIAKESLQGKQILAQNILKMIKEVEQTSQIFTIDEDRRFFQELQGALRNKDEVMKICQNESSEFVDMIQQQLKELLLKKDQLTFPEDRIIKDQEFKGQELKENVAKSLQLHLNQKIPTVFKLIQTSIYNWEEKQRKMRAVHAHVQTETQTTKVSESKRKIALIQHQIRQIQAQKSKLVWELQEKESIITKYQGQLSQMKTEFNQKIYDNQKQIKSLEERIKKYKEELQKQKSRRFIQNTETNLKSAHSFIQHQQPTLKQPTPKQPSQVQNEQQQQPQRLKKKKTMLNITKSSGKFYLPTIKKINSDDSQLLNLIENSNKTYLTQGESLIEHQNSFAESKKENLISSAKISITKNTSIKRSQSRKNAERLSSKPLIQNSINQSISESAKPKYKIIKTERGESKGKLNNSPGLPFLPKAKPKVDLKDKKMMEVVDIKNIHSSSKRKTPSEQNEVKQSDMKEMREQVFMISEKIKQRIPQQSAINSSRSNKSILKNKSSVKQKNASQQIKDREDKQSQISHSLHKNQKQMKEEVRNSNPQVRAKVQKQKPQLLSKLEDRQIQNNQSTLLSKLQRIQLESNKSYLLNKFQKINEEIEKQNYMTPLFKNDSRDIRSSQKIQQNNAVHNLLHLYQQIPKGQCKNDKVSLLRFKQIFERYIDSIKANPNQVSKQRIIKESKYKKDNIINSISLKLKLKENQEGNSGNVSKDNQLESQMNSTKMQIKMTKGNLKEISINSSYILSPKQAKQISRSKNVLATLENMLFFNEKIAYIYQTHLSKKNYKSKTVVSPLIQQYLNEIFHLLQGLKNQNPQFYHQITGFLRYPYSHSQNGLLQVDILKNLSLASLTQCFLHILDYHSKCSIEKLPCNHLAKFKIILESNLNRISK